MIKDLAIWIINNPLESFVIIFLQYCFVMTIIHRTKDTILAPVVKYTLVPVFVIQDWLYNITAMTVLMLDLPDGPFELVTGRMKRYKRELSFDGDPYTYLNWLERYQLGFAKFLCKQLNRFDIGHC